jgi:predicted ribosomally synthesized peptide with SipW-like signal peptide
LIGKVLIAVLAVGLAGSLAGGGLLAYFSDVETSTANTFQASNMDLAVGSDWYDGGVEHNPWPQAIPLINPAETEDIKPGHTGGTEISLHAYCVAGSVHMRIFNTTSGENTRIGPELKAGDPSEDIGELADYLWLELWEDNGPDGDVQTGDTGEGDNIPQVGENPIWSGYASELSACTMWELPTILPHGQAYYLGVRWEFRGDNGSGIDVNQAQGDTFGCDIQFIATEPGDPAPICP